MCPVTPRRFTSRTLLTFGLLCGMAIPAAGQQRPYRIDDYFSTEDIIDDYVSTEDLGGSLTMPPDGQAVAFTKRRAANTQLTNGLLISETRSDIWLQEAPGRPARNLTNGQADSSGWWAPHGSRTGSGWPSCPPGVEKSRWAWERQRNQLGQLSTDGVDFSDAGGCRWVDAQRLLCLAVPEGERSTPVHRYYGPSVERTEAAWAKAKQGELTASVVNSLEFKLPSRRLLLLDVISGTSHTLADTQLLDMDYANFPASCWWLSPRRARGGVRAVGDRRLRSSQTIVDRVPRRGSSFAALTAGRCG